MHLEEARTHSLLVPYEAVEEVLAAIGGGCRPTACAANDEGVRHRELAALLPQLLAPAAAWAQAQEARALAAGRRLARWQQDDARQVGVLHPERVRVQYVDVLPEPTDEFQALAEQSRFLAPGGPGATFGYGVLILRRHAGQRRALRHLLRHVAQFEAAGSLPEFVALCLRQIAHVGLENAPFELEAQSHEVAGRRG